MLSKIKGFVGQLCRFYRHYIKDYHNSEFGFLDKSATIISPLNISGINNVYLYENTGINNAIILATNAKFIMKNHSGAANGLLVITGNHERRIGRFYRTITEKEKSKNLDKDVIVEEDCWLGARVTLLSGVIVRRGTTVAAGAVVTKSTAPYSIVGGVPARHIKFYWSIEEIIEHESILYPEEERLTREQLEFFFKMY